MQQGNINHSSHFLRRFLNTAFAYLQQNVQTFLATNLECTGNLPVICIKPDKFTKKGQSNQAVIIRYPALKHGKLFRETYLGHLPCGESSTGHAVTELMMRSLYETTGYDLSVARDVISGIACDGAYISTHISMHLAEQIQVPLDFAKQATTWDFAHRIERLDLHAREKSKWIFHLDSQIRSFMKDNKDHGQRRRIEEKCVELGIQFRAFVLYSDTRFAQYRDRTYNVFVHLNGVLYK